VTHAERWRRYEARKAAFLRAHPGATAAEIEAACREIARQEGI
jgi:hypothetical protein